MPRNGSAAKRELKPAQPKPTAALMRPWGGPTERARLAINWAGSGRPGRRPEALASPQSNHARRGYLDALLLRSDHCWVGLGAATRFGSAVPGG